MRRPIHWELDIHKFKWRRRRHRIICQDYSFWLLLLLVLSSFSGNNNNCHSQWHWHWHPFRRGIASDRLASNFSWIIRWQYKRRPLAHPIPIYLHKQSIKCVWIEQVEVHVGVADFRPTAAAGNGKLLWKIQTKTESETVEGERDKGRETEREKERSVEIKISMWKRWRTWNC